MFNKKLSLPFGKTCPDRKWIRKLLIISDPLNNLKLTLDPSQAAFKIGGIPLLLSLNGQNYDVAKAIYTNSNCMAIDDVSIWSSLTQDMFHLQRQGFLGQSHLYAINRSKVAVSERINALRMRLSESTDLSNTYHTEILTECSNIEALLMNCTNQNEPDVLKEFDRIFGLNNIKPPAGMTDYIAVMSPEVVSLIVMVRKSFESAKSLSDSGNNKKIDSLRETLAADIASVLSPNSKGALAVLLNFMQGAETDHNLLINVIGSRSLVEFLLGCHKLARSKNFKPSLAYIGRLTKASKPFSVFTADGRSESALDRHIKKALLTTLDVVGGFDTDEINQISKIVQKTSSGMQDELQGDRMMSDDKSDDAEPVDIAFELERVQPHTGFAINVSQSRYSGFDGDVYLGDELNRTFSRVKSHKHQVKVEQPIKMNAPTGTGMPLGISEHISCMESLLWMLFVSGSEDLSLVRIMERIGSNIYMCSELCHYGTKIRWDEIPPMQPQSNIQQQLDLVKKLDISPYRHYLLDVAPANFFDKNITNTVFLCINTQRSVYSAMTPELFSSLQELQAGIDTGMFVQSPPVQIPDLSVVIKEGTLKEHLETLHIENDFANMVSDTFFAENNLGLIISRVISDIPIKALILGSIISRSFIRYNGNVGSGLYENVLTNVDSPLLNMSKDLLQFTLFDELNFKFADCSLIHFLGDIIHQASYCLNAYPIAVDNAEGIIKASDYYQYIAAGETLRCWLLHTFSMFLSNVLRDNADNLSNIKCEFDSEFAVIHLFKKTQRKWVRMTTMYESTIDTRIISKEDVENQMRKLFNTNGRNSQVPHPILTKNISQDGLYNDGIDLITNSRDYVDRLTEVNMYHFTRYQSEHGNLAMNDPSGVSTLSLIHSGMSLEMLDEIAKANLKILENKH